MVTLAMDYIGNGLHWQWITLAMDYIGNVLHW